jgi:hypothetical protein
MPPAIRTNPLEATFLNPILTLKQSVMKRSFTLFATVISLLGITNISSGQTCSMSATNPNPSPAFSTAQTVDELNGFTSPDQSPVGKFPKGTTTTLESPVYFYTSAQSATYFKYNLATTTGSSLITGYSITLYCETLTAQSCSNTVSYPVTTTGTDYYFSISPLTAIPSNKYYKVVITLTLAGGGNKDVFATSFQSNGRLAPAGTILPVKFSSFDVNASDNTNNLVWNVGVEENLSGYEVERSADGRSFSRIAFVNAAGSSRYAYADSKISGTVYYRITSVDVDGRFGYSPVVAVKNGDASVVLNAFPMPVISDVTIQHAKATKGSLITISSVEGRTIKSITPAAGAQQTVINFSSLNKGVYMLRFTTTEGAVETLKLIRQ